MSIRSGLKQRADYTHKFNSKTGRHGWLRLTPAYSVKVVEELIEACTEPMRVFDPFSGTATTTLSAAYHGHQGVTTDINPFLVWFGKVKTAHYSDAALKSTHDACRRVLNSVRLDQAELVAPPPIHNIQRWWSPQALAFLQAVRGAIDAETKHLEAERDLLLVAFCRSLISVSNASFNHQSMSFKDGEQASLDLGIDFGDVFSSDVHFVLEGARNNPTGRATVILGDSRSPKDTVKGSFDRVITSPPYANRMSYIRELRPYMYWLGFLGNGRDAGELDWAAIGGTWGIATSRLIGWERTSDRFRHPMLDAALKEIASSDNKNGQILSNYVAKYFDDMWTHFQGLVPVLEKNAEAHYIVGNSTFYGVLLPVEQLYAAMLSELGFADVVCNPIRKRNSNKKLIEFDVIGHWRRAGSGRRKARVIAEA